MEQDMASMDFLNKQHKNEFYRIYQPRFIFILMGAVVVAMIWTGIVIFQVHHRPLPTFYASESNGKRMILQPQDSPSLRPATILRFASKAAVAAYTFDFVNYKQEIDEARVYFTSDGWSSYLASVSEVLKRITENKLFVSAVVDGAPIISNEGELDGVYSWRVQIPFLVNYQSAQTAEKSRYTVLITVVRIPTVDNPVGIGIDSFVMS